MFVFWGKWIGKISIKNKIKINKNKGKLKTRPI